MEEQIGYCTLWRVKNWNKDERKFPNYFEAITSCIGLVTVSACREHPVLISCDNRVEDKRLETFVLISPASLFFLLFSILILLLFLYFLFAPFSVSSFSYFSFSSWAENGATWSSIEANGILTHCFLPLQDLNFSFFCSDGDWISFDPLLWRHESICVCVSRSIFS